MTSQELNKWAMEDMDCCLNLKSTVNPQYQNLTSAEVRDLKLSEITIRLSEKTSNPAPFKEWSRNRSIVDIETL